MIGDKWVAIVVMLVLGMRSSGVQGQMQTIKTLLEFPSDVEQMVHGVTRFVQAPFTEPSRALDRASGTFQQTIRDASRSLGVAINVTNDNFKANVKKVMSDSEGMLAYAMNEMRVIAPTIAQEAAGQAVTALLNSQQINQIIIAMFLIGGGLWATALPLVARCTGVDRWCQKQQCCSKNSCSKSACNNRSSTPLLHPQPGPSPPPPPIEDHIPAPATAVSVLPSNNETNVSSNNGVALELTTISIDP